MRKALHQSVQGFKTVYWELLMISTMILAH